MLLRLGVLVQLGDLGVMSDSDDPPPLVMSTDDEQKHRKIEQPRPSSTEDSSEADSSDGDTDDLCEMIKNIAMERRKKQRESQCRGVSSTMGTSSMEEASTNAGNRRKRRTKQQMEEKAKAKAKTNAKANAK